MYLRLLMHHIGRPNFRKRNLNCDPVIYAIAMFFGGANIFSFLSQSND